MMPCLAVISFLNALVFLKLQVCKNLFAIEHDEQTRREIYRKCLDGNGFSHLDDGENTSHFPPLIVIMINSTIVK